MREIKFRFWNNDTNQMWSSQDLVDNEYYLLADMRIHISFDLGENGTDCEEFTIMQYTGLKDKNGKEIYEGDVVGMGDPLIVTFGLNGENEGWHVSRARDGYQYSMHAFTTPWLVRGNIHENPELLKQQP